MLMRLHEASGDGARALRVYHECATTLQRELGMAPSAATREVYEALLRIAAAPASPEPGSASPAAAPLVGRLVQRSQLATLWRAADRGASQLVLVTGEPGIGKTRLVDELRSWCAHNGAMTAEARAYPAEGAMAFGMVVAWLRSEPIAARLPRLGRAHLTELARLLPGLLSEMPGLPAPEPLPESEHRQRLFDASRARSSRRAHRCCSSLTTSSGATPRPSSSSTTCCAPSPRRVCSWRRPHGAKTWMPSTPRANWSPRCRGSAASRRSRSAGLPVSRRASSPSASPVAR